ncbi:bifunctional 2-polyprenyl-6-hydroxyphenol methylase/3-demethylubiquinol 3-O-methyltransferase UbiG [Parvularcula sp. IMCC14364]|uniref:bifunctional 2-polyprenyl-6-hydroxyphenol methylase/3-demethylubiquinol 3-O-methyltransferase UbiG n=1 Tax=Parvularcula sp. IMCC14364 TaxID=3067902 RepID=UPI003556945B
MTMATTIDPDEIEKFSAIAAEWWDPLGKFKPLHKFNPARLGHIRDELCQHFDRDRFAGKPLEGLKLIDIGCGGGLVSEPMARLGAAVTGIDAGENNVKTALAHALEQDLEIDYRHTTVEELTESESASFDVVLNLEVVEHVADTGLFLSASAELLKPGGIMITATINRTMKALLTAKIGAEYILRWLPAGTHDPRKFVRPTEIRDVLEAAGLQVRTPVGMNYQPLLDAWRISDDASVNYMITSVKPPRS